MKYLVFAALLSLLIIGCESSDDTPDPRRPSPSINYIDSISLINKYPNKIIWLNHLSPRIDTFQIFRFNYSTNTIGFTLDRDNGLYFDSEFAIRNDSTPFYFASEVVDTTFVSTDGALCYSPMDSLSCFSKWNLVNGKMVSFLEFGTITEELIWDNNYENVIEKRLNTGALEGLNEIYTYYDKQTFRIGNIALLLSNFKSNPYRVYSGFSYFSSKDLLKSITVINASGVTATQVNFEYFYDQQNDILTINGLITDDYVSNRLFYQFIITF